MTPQEIVNHCQPHPMHRLIWRAPWTDKDHRSHLGTCESFVVFGQPPITRDDLDHLAGSKVTIDYTMRRARIRSEAFITTVAVGMELELTLQPTGPLDIGLSDA